MLHVESGVTVGRPVDEVFDFIANPENNPLWQEGMAECRITSPPPFGLGSSYDQVARFLGRRVGSSFEIVAYEEGRLIRGSTVASSFPITFTRRTEPAPGGTAVTTVVEGDAGRFFRVATPLLRRMVKRSIDGDYRRLKRVLEG